MQLSKHINNYIELVDYTYVNEKLFHDVVVACPATWNQARLAVVFCKPHLKTV